MEIELGDEIIYKFPDPLVKNKNSFIGIVDFIGESFIFIKNENNIRLKISFKNFHLITKKGIERKFF